MSNPYRFNAQAKRQRVNRSGAYQDRVVFEEDFNVIHARESHLSRRNLPVETPRSQWVEEEEWAPEDNTEMGLDPSEDAFEQQMDAPITDSISTSVIGMGVRRLKTMMSERPHRFWKEKYRDTFLDEMLRYEGRGEFRAETQCPECTARQVEVPSLPEFRCVDCFLPDLVCSTCIRRRHRGNPLHVIEKWTGSHFSRVTLKSIGLRVQLGHASMRCLNPEACHSTLRIFHTNGIHDVAVDFCGCSRALPKHIQLLRRGWYPGSQKIPKTLATFRLLAQLHILSLSSKCSTYDFYRSLEKLTDNVGTALPSSRYRALMRMLLQWRHLKMLKRAGRGHDPTGVAGTKEGELAVLCPSCPRPGINLPEDWESAPDETKFLYYLFLCMDANFRLKSQMASSYSTDPGLGIGMAYMAAWGPYEEYVLSRASDDDISTCVGFQALAKANTRFSRGLRYTGLGMVSCGRGEVIMPNGAGNLPKGERYANMDYIYGSVIKCCTLLLVVISYDIACQWFVNLFSRIESQWPEHIKPAQHLKMRPQIPAFHEPAHGRAKHDEYSFKLTHGSGTLEGECPERIWAGNNAVANSTKTMGPGSRDDVLDDHFGFWNWQKYSGMGASLMRKYKAAVIQRNIQVEAHRGLTVTLPEALSDRWEAVCRLWDHDTFPKRSENPYATAGVSVSESSVRKELADEEELRLEDGGLVLHETSPSSFMVLALELEESQRRIRILAKDRISGATSLQQASLTEQRNVLRTKIRNWEAIRSLYMPGLLLLQADFGRNPTAPARSDGFRLPSSSNPEDTDLWLPSSIHPSRRPAVFDSSLSSIEERLRTAQCFDALDGLRHWLQVKSRMVLFKNKNIRGQRGGTRSRAIIDRVHAKASGLAERYRHAREARVRLSGPGAWETTLRPLLDEDIRSYSDPNRLRERQGRGGTVEDEALGSSTAGSTDQASDPRLSLLPERRGRRDGTGESRRTLSWIWLMEGFTNADANDDILRSEWAKSRARAARATEEVLLLREEMRRVLAFLKWRTKWWRDRKDMRQGVDGGLAEGLQAYVEEQAGVQQSLESSFRKIWKGPLEEAASLSQPGEGQSTQAVGAEGAIGDDDDDDEDQGGDEEGYCPGELDGFDESPFLDADSGDELGL